MQETGETRDAIIEEDNRLIQKIVDENKDRRNPYWIVLFAKPSKHYVDGKHTLVKHIKAYGTKPISQVGALIGEVNNQTGVIKWEVNMPQRPFDFDKLLTLGAKPCDEVVIETTTIPHAYITQ
jgi:hypothetical protein